MLAVIPLACVIGNSLVIAAVWTTKSLQTPTNYLLVSLACADLLIGMLVMPFNIYVSVRWSELFPLPFYLSYKAKFLTILCFFIFGGVIL